MKKEDIKEEEEDDKSSSTSFNQTELSFQGSEHSQSLHFRDRKDEVRFENYPEELSAPYPVGFEISKDQRNALKKSSLLL